ncbi:MAG: FtsQ-type POTRA domain-containing protein [bacterium]
MTRRTTGNHRRKGGSSRHHLLEVNVRTASMHRQRRSKAGMLLWKVFAVITVLILVAAGVRIGAEKFFFRNPEYSLRHLNAKLDGVLSQEELVALTGFGEGKNLFSLDLDEANRKLSALPEVRSGSVNIERILPDTIQVKLERRIPIFLFAGNGENGESFASGKSFLCDRDGFLMQPNRLDPEFLNLPVLRGIDSGKNLPGTRLENDRLCFAIMLQQALSEIPEETFKIRSIDVSKEYAAVVTDASNARFMFGNNDIAGQIERLRKLLAHCQETGRQIESANLMVVRNTPVTFVLTPERGSAKITPVPGAKKSPRQNAR